MAAGNIPESKAELETGAAKKIEVAVSSPSLEAEKTISFEKLPVTPETEIKKSETLPVEKSVQKVAETVAPAVVTANSSNKARAKAIDGILSDGLHEVFLQMDSNRQKEFKRVGEETTAKINILLDKAKVKVDKIIDLIRRWLKLIPRINSFFLEQEVKIKADKIIKLKDLK